MSLILNLESTTTVCSVALSDGDKIIALKETNKENSHSQLMSVFVEEIFNENKITAKDLSAVAVSKGPGSYTGLRIGVSLAKGICYGAEIPLIAIDTLYALAHGYKSANKIELDAMLCPMIDARRMEVYNVVYHSTLYPINEVSAKVIDKDSFAEQLDHSKIYFFGNGAMKCKEHIKSKNARFDDFNCSAKYMAAPAYERLMKKQFEDTAYFEPYYLKDFVAIPAKNKVF